MSFPGGALADRHSKKALIIGADAAIALIVTAALSSVAAGIQKPAVIGIGILPATTTCTFRLWRPWALQV